MDKVRPIGPRPAVARLALESRRRAAWPTNRTFASGLTLSALLVVGCATVRPDFQRTFRAGRSSHDLWMDLLVTRYGCDTVMVVANTPRREEGVGLPSLTRPPQRTMQVGMGACDMASLIAPETVAGWVTPEGTREEWKFRLHNGVLASVYLEGREARMLRVVPPLP
jgi:hypothetical protein